MQVVSRHWGKCSGNLSTWVQALVGRQRRQLKILINSFEVHGAEEASANQLFLGPQTGPGEPSASADPIQHILAAGRNAHEQLDHRKNRRVPEKNIYFCFIDYAKAFDCVDPFGKFFKKLEYQTTLPASWQICMEVKKQQLEQDMEQQTGSKSGKDKLESRLLEEISITTDMQMTSPLCWKVKRN